ncbi:ABC transporter substrate-binding protein [Trichococcus flocculiformis]|uniref:ABC transporter substrate-binding protein n=1 Tax=Trichococcus flocculiformis TaxID=82803 RepID=UPI002AAA8E80|nr:sugar ABC transporter substrate-binding protein [Trichococcus flocculiformis]
MKRHLFSKTLALLSGMAVLTACGGGNAAEEAEQQVYDGEDVTIQVAAWNVAADALEATIPDFNEEYPNIKVEILRVDADYSKVTPSLAAGSGAPDVIQVNGSDFQAFMKKFPGQFMNIEENVADKKDEFVDFVWANVSDDEGIYAMPWDIGPAGLFYRTDLFDAAGINIEDIKTWDDYIAAGKQLKEAIPGTAMTGYDESTAFYKLFLNQLGGSFVNEEGTIGLASPESETAISLVKEMVDEGVAIPVQNWDGRITALSNDKIASLFTPVWYAGTLQTALEQQSGKWSVAPLPAFEEGQESSANSGGSVLAVTTQSENQEAAYLFIENAMATQEGQEIMLENALFPSWMPIYDTETFAEVNEYFGMDINSFFAGQTDKIKPAHFGSIMLDAGKPLLDMQSRILAGEDVQTVLKETAEDISEKTGVEVQK